MSVRLPLGNDSFTRIRENENYYVDKTGIIEELLEQSFMVSLITRPRRFGKTLMMSMLEAFFDITRDNGKYFDGLKISENTFLCKKWQNQWPVVFLTLKTVEGLNFDSALGMLGAVLSDICKKYAFLGESEQVNRADRELFLDLEYQRADETTIKNSLMILTRMMMFHFGKPCILLIDEYDVPLAKASEHGYYKEMLDILRAMFSALKTNEYLKFAVVTGCLRISKESIFTGTNNFVSDSISKERYDEYFGFTEEDVQKLLKDTGLTDHQKEIKEWYDGYRFGSADVYCPWDVMNHAAALCVHPDTSPGLYWANTSSNYILKRVLKKAGRTVKNELERLIDGESILKKITEQITYEDLDRSITNLWSVLYLSGYLTIKRMDENGRAELRIPNREIREIFISQISEWFTETVSADINGEWSDFCRALETGEAEKAERLLTGFLGKSISIRDTAAKKSKKENFYHGLLLGLIMTKDDWNVYSNHEDGDGYSDIHVETDAAAFVLEIKYAENDRLDQACQEALRQIREKRYAEDLTSQGFPKVFAYGVGCYKKHCRIVCETM